MDELDEIIKQINDEFGEGTITTANEIPRPQSSLDREAFDDFNTRNPMAGGGMLVQPSADGSRPGYSGRERGTGEWADQYAASTIAKKRLEAEKKGLVYDTKTKKFRKKKERGPNKNPNPLKGKLIDTNPDQKFLDIAEKKYSKDFGNKTGLALWEAIGRNKRAGIKSGSITGEKTGVNLATSIPEGKISQGQLIELIKESTGKEFKRSIISDIRPGKKNYIQNKIRELLNIKSSPFKSGKGTFYYFDKPTPEQLEFIGNYIEAPHLMDRTVRNMKLMEKNFGKLLANSTKKDAVDFFTNEMTIDKVKEMFKKNGVKDITDSKAALALTRYAQSLQGKLFKNVDGIPENSKVGDFIFQAFNSLDKYHPWKQGSYQAVLDDINKNMGKKAGNLSAFKTKFREKMQTLYPDGRIFDFNEVFSITTSANRGSYPYAYFVDLTSNAMNTGALSTYQGKASIAEGKIQTALRNFRRTGNKKFYNEAVRVANVFNNSTRKLFLSSEKVLQYQKDYGIKPNALKIEVGSQRQVADKINFASDYFSNKNLQKWKNLGIDIDAHSGRAGYVKTFGGKGVPSNVITAGELFTEDTRLGKKTKVFDEDALKKFLKKNLALLGCPKGLQRASGGRVEFSEGSTCPMKGKQRLEAILKKGAVPGSDDAMLATKILQAGRGLGSAFALRNILGPAAIGFTALAEAGLVGYDMLSEGKTFREAVGDSLFNYALGEKTKIDPQEELFKRFEGLGYDNEQMFRIKKALDTANTINTGMNLGMDIVNQQEKVDKLGKQYEQDSQQIMIPEDEMMQSDQLFRAQKDLQNKFDEMSTFNQDLSAVAAGDTKAKEDILNEYIQSGQYAQDLNLFSNADRLAEIERLENINNPFAGRLRKEEVFNRLRELKLNDPNVRNYQEMTGGYPIYAGFSNGGYGKDAAKYIKEIETDHHKGYQYYKRHGGKKSFKQYMRESMSKYFAGGGIAGLSGGDPEGAMTRSMNPDSQGLSYLFNRVKKT